MEGLPREIGGGAIPIKAWAHYIEAGAEQQARNAANHPFAFHHIALMPDVHAGMGACIGEVAAMEGVVVTQIVGVDIGCGMRACKTSLKKQDLPKSLLEAILTDLKQDIPVGFDHRTTPLRDLMPAMDRAAFEQSAIVKNEWDSATYQMGTLGGGNHFWESQYDLDDNVWIMIHSGSRNIGNKTAIHYSKLARQLNEEWSWDSKIPAAWQLDFLPLTGKNKKYGEAYMREMNWCLDFAKTNRQIMMDSTKRVFKDHIGCTFDEDIDVHHNYCAWENHFGKNVVVHRKGATSARHGQLGIIPGSQGTASYIVEGLGNPESFMSCSHGAGRTLSRSKAKQTLNLADEIQKLDDQGIIHSIREIGDLDEAAGAYKNIEEVMAYQDDLVKPITTLRPMAVIKG